MPNPPRAAGDVGGDGNNDDREKTVAKTLSYVVFSGIAISVLKSLNPFNNNNHSSEPLSESTRSAKTLCCRSSHQQPPLQEPLPLPQSVVTTSVERNVVESTAKTIEIVKGDTLWDLSRRYGVSIGAIKEANGLTGDTIYVGKKLTIPL